MSTRSTLATGVGVGVGAGVPEGAGVGDAGTGLTLVVTLAVLLAVLVSGVDEETTAVFVIVLSPGAVTLTTIVTEAKPGDGMSPRLATTLLPERLQEPWLAVHDRKVVPPGSGSLTVTAIAVFGPLLLMLRV